MPTSSPLKICFAAAEATPFAKTGGLADVAAALPQALHKSGHDVRVFIPFYSRIVPRDIAVSPVAQVQNVPVSMGAERVEFSLLRTTLPSGTRFALKMTPAEIEQWLDSRGYTGQLRITARAFARALVDYGWFVTDTSCTASNFQVEGGANPETAAAWRALGIAGDGRNLLGGLITRNRIWTVQAPVNHCVDGRNSRLACAARSARVGGRGSSLPLI